MKRLILVSILGFSFLLTKTSYSQVKVNGWLQSSLYAWENLNEDKQWDYYQGLQLRIAHEQYSDLYFNTFLREAYRGDPQEWKERVYNLYVNWKFYRNYKLRVGRQFLYRGVINGTMDAGVLTGKVARNLLVSAVVGTEAPYERTFKVRQWDDGNVLGGYLAYNLPWKNSINVSYFQKQRESDLYWQQVGSALDGFLFEKLNYYARFDYNILSSYYQAMRYRLTYYETKWSLGVEFHSQRPRVYEDSYFNIFEIEAFSQIRSAGTYRFGNYEVGLQYLYTQYEDDNDNRVIGSIGHNKYGTLGIIYQNGYGGENIGYYADIRYEIIPNLTARLFNSYYNYERAYTNISEDALAFSAGLKYRLKNILILDGELQQSSNTYYKNDLRGLLRLTYLFNI